MSRSVAESESKGKSESVAGLFDREVDVEVGETVLEVLVGAATAGI